MTSSATSACQSFTGQLTLAIFLLVFFFLVTMPDALFLCFCLLMLSPGLLLPCDHACRLMKVLKMLKAVLAILPGCLNASVLVTQVSQLHSFEASDARYMGLHVVRQPPVSASTNTQDKESTMSKL